VKLKFYQRFVELTLFKYVDVFLFSYKRPMEFWSIISDSLNLILKVMKYNMFTKAAVLNDICVVDWVNKGYRFEIIYNLFSCVHAFRFFLK